MLSELRIKNFAIIDQLEVEFADGFNVITGETGAGKSIIIDAVELLLGGRADGDFIRAGNDRAVVEGVFTVPHRLATLIVPLLERENVVLESAAQLTPPDPKAGKNGKDPSGKEGVKDGNKETGKHKTIDITLTREIRANGRHVCRIDGSTVSLSVFRSVGERLIDIHGQSEHLSLLKPTEHLVLLDRFANVEMYARVYQVGVDKLHAVRSELRSLMQDEAALARRAELLKYQIEEITAVNPQPGEDEALAEESIRLSNSEQLSRLTAEACAALDGEDDTGTLSAVPLLNQVAVVLGKLTRLDTRFTEDAKLALEVTAQAEELARTLHHYADGIEHNPARLEEVEDRIDVLNRLKKKYGGTVEAVVAFRDKVAAEFDAITNSGARIEELQKEEDHLLHEIGKMGVRLSDMRKAAAIKLAEGIEKELADLRMEGARFDVSILQEEVPDGAYVDDQRVKFDSTGIDQVEFLMAANRGEPLKPLAKVASGGETARIMLALKGVLSRADQTPTLIFDEIDQGIGGRVGATVGQKLWGVSVDHQVLCVTHLAQIAGFGDVHFKVQKQVRSARTVTSVSALQGDQRVNELAEMLGADTDNARLSAQDILMMARRMKSEAKGTPENGKVDLARKPTNGAGKENKPDGKTDPSGEADPQDDPAKPTQPALL